MTSQPLLGRSLLAVGVSVAVLGLSGLAPDDFSSNDLSATGLMSQAYAAQGGSGQGGPQGGAGGKDGSGKGRQGDAGGGVPAAPDGTGGGPGESGSGVILGRMSMAKAYTSPNFDPSKIDDPEAPLANLEAYRTILLEGMVYPADGSAPFPVEPTLENLASYLAKVATAPITGESITVVNDYLDQYQGGVSAAFAATGISADALATRINELVKEGHEE